MNKNWKTYRLQDITTRIGSGATPRGGKESYIETGEISLIRSQNVLDFSFSNDGLAFISSDQADKLNNVKVKEEDILLNITGDSVARVCMVPDSVIPARVNQHVAIVRAQKDKVNPYFLKYYMLQPAFKGYMLGMAAAGATRKALTKGMIENFEINLPNLSTQDEIAQTLSSLDNKIELNLQMNETLEKMAQEVLYDRLGRYETEDELPEGWVYYDLTQLVESVSITHKFPKGEAIFLNTSDLIDGEILHHKFTRKSALPGQAKKSIAKGDILFTEIRPANKRYAFIDFESEDYVVSTKLMVLRSRGLVDNLVTYFYLKSPFILRKLQVLAESRSGTFPQITYSELKKIKMAVPTNELLKEISSLVEVFHQMKRKNQKENILLIQLRDSLLPRLMAGKIGLN